MGREDIDHGQRHATPEFRQSRSSSQQQCSAKAKKAGVINRLQQTQAKRRAKKANTTGEMTLVEHLRELRRRIIVSLIALVIGSIIGFVWYQSAPFGWQPLGEILRTLLCIARRKASVVYLGWRMSSSRYQAIRDVYSASEGWRFWLASCCRHLYGFIRSGVSLPRVFIRTRGAARLYL